MSQDKTLFWKKLLIVFLFPGTVLLALVQVMPVAGQPTPTFSVSTQNLDQTVCQQVGQQLLNCAVTIYGNNLPPQGVHWSAVPQRYASPYQGLLFPNKSSMSVSISGLSCASKSNVVKFVFNSTPTYSIAVTWSCSASTPAPTATTTMTPTTSPTNSPTAVASSTPTASVTLTPTPVPLATNPSTSNNSPCIEVNIASQCVPLSSPPTPYSYSSVPSLTITGKHWNKKVHLELYFVAANETFTARQAALALVPASQGVCPSIDDFLARSSIVVTDRQGGFTAQLSIPGTIPSGTYDVCAVGIHDKPVIASQSGSILLFSVSINRPNVSPSESRLPINRTNGASSFDLFSFSLSLFSLLFALAAFLIYFFGPKRSLTGGKQL